MRAALHSDGRDYAWLSKTTGIRYKKILRVVKHEESPLMLNDAIVIAGALGVELPELIGAAA